MKLRYILILAMELIILIAILPKNCNHINIGPIIARVSKQVHYDLYVSADFDIDEVEIIKDACNEWNDKTKGLIVYSIYYNFNDDLTKIKNNGRTIIVEKLSEWDPITNGYDNNLSNHMLGYYEVDTKIPTIYLVSDRMLGIEYYRSVILHEIFHSLGGKHTDEENTLEYPYQNKSAKHITHSDLVQFCRMYGCSADKLMPLK